MSSLLQQRFDSLLPEARVPAHAHPTHVLSYAHPSKGHHHINSYHSGVWIDLNLSVTSEPSTAQLHLDVQHQAVLHLGGDTEQAPICRFAHRDLERRSEGAHV